MQKRCAYLVAVFNNNKILAKLPVWTNDNENDIVRDVKLGKERLITDMDADQCKADLEEGGAATVEVRNC